jgi:hypothetical protein
MMALPTAQSNDVVAVADPQQLAAAAGWGSRRITVATMELKIAITVDAGTTLALEDLEKIEDDFHALKKKTRKFMQDSISKYDVDEADTPPEKQMKCGVSGGPWTTSLIVRKPLAVEDSQIL